MASKVHESTLVSFYVYNPQLGHKEGTEHLKILYYYPEDETLNRKIRNIGLCEALVNFSRTFSSDQPCEAVHTQRRRQVYFEPEPGIWIVMSVSVPWAEVTNNGEKTVEYYDGHIQNSVLDATLKGSYSTFRLFHRSISSINKQFGLDAVKRRLKTFFSRYLQTLNVASLDIFNVFQGVQFLPLNKYMYLKVHCFVNLVETTFRTIQRTVLLFGDQLVWSGLEQDDIRIFYHYLLSCLFPSHFGHDFLSSLSLPPTSLPPSSSSSSSSSSASVAASVTAASQSLTGSFLIGQSVGGGGAGESGRSPWVYITVDGTQLTCRLFVYNVAGATMCFFVQTEQESPTDDFSKRLGAFLGPRLAQISRDIAEFNKQKPPNPDQQFRYIYFNEMNLAVKSPLLPGRRLPAVAISPDAMRLLAVINAEYDRLEEGESIMRTLSDYWVICRKSGHRRLYVILYKSANFQEINEEVRRLCLKEFTNIFFLD